MGLESVELVMEVEEAFGIRLEDAEASRVRTVNDLYQLVLSKTVTTISPQYRCIDQHVFYRLRRHLMDYGHSRSAVTPSTPLEMLVPTLQRRQFWKQMGLTTDLRLPAMHVTPLGCVIIALAVLSPMAIFYFSWGGGLFLGGLVSLLFVPMLLFFTWLSRAPVERLSDKLPAQTLGEFARLVAAKNHAHLTAALQTKCRQEQVLQHLIMIISDQLGFRPQDIKPEHDLYKHLGLD